MNKYTYTIEVDLKQVEDFLWEEGGLNEYVDMIMSMVTEIVYDELAEAIRDYMGAGEDDE